MTKSCAVLLLQKGLTQKEIADRMGVHQPKVSEWLRGKRIPNSKSIFKLAQVLNEQPDELMNKILEISAIEE